MILGYPLGSHSQGYRGPLTFITPLTIEWLPSGARTPLIDSGVHGYHAEIGSTSAQMRGVGDPVPWSCPNCGKQRFTVRVHFDYLGASADLWEDEPTLSIENYFTGIRVEGVCQRCDHTSLVSGMNL